MAHFQEIYHPVKIEINGSASTTGNGIAGFLCTATGVLNATSGGVNIINALAVTAGVYYPMPFALINGTVTLSGGGAGTLAVCY